MGCYCHGWNARVAYGHVHPAIVRDGEIITFGGIPVHLGTIIAGCDALAVDVIALNLIRKLGPLPHKIDYIETLKEEVGLMSEKDILVFEENL